MSDLPTRSTRRSPPEAEPSTRGAQPDDLHAMPHALAEIAARFGHFRIDLASGRVTWSVGVASIFGRPLPAAGVLDLDEHLACYHPQDAAVTRNALAAARAGGYVDRPYRSQGRVIRPDGTLRHVIAQGIGRGDGRGRLATTFGILLDVTETVEADRAARANGDVLRTTFEAMDQGLIMVDGDQRLRVHNRRALDLVGMPDHLTRPGTPFSDLLRHQQAAGEFDQLNEAEKAVLPIGSAGCGAGCYVRRRPNGTVLEVRTSPLADGGFVRTYTDISDRQARQAALEASEERYRLLAETTTDVVILSDLDSTRRYVSPAARTVLGYEPQELIGTSPIAFVHPDEADALAAVLDDLAQARREKASATVRHRRKDGAYVWVEISYSLVREAGSRTATGYVAALRDVSDRKAAEDALRLSEQRLAFALESGGDGMWSFDLERDHVMVSDRWWSILGYHQHEVAPTFAGWHALAHPDDRERIVQAMRDHFEGRSPAIEVEYRLRAKSGGYVWTLARGRVANTGLTGRPTLLIGTHMDITRRKEVERTAAHLALHDVLTKLPNRALFQERLRQEIAAAERHGGSFAVLACDLDRFKAVNDALGHAAGDDLLREIAGRLQTVIRTEDLVARLGGDEFAVVLSRISGREDGFLAARRLIAAVEQPIRILGQQVDVGISIGLAFGLDDGGTADELCRRSDTALYAAKAGGRNTYRAFQTSMDAELADRALLEGDLHDAVRGDGFVLCFQPIFALKTGAVTGFEALLRWNHPTRGPISPAEFIPLAEQIGLMGRLGEWALRDACREAAAWPGALRVSVNISPVQLQRPGLEQCVISALACSGLAPSRLVLEITEEVLVEDAEAVFASVSRLREIGVRFSLDDFGTGFSSLNHLRQFCFDAIKLHHSVVRDLGSEAAAVMVRAIIGLRSRPDFEIIAEGIETRGELTLVRGLGCTGVQGFLFSKPLLAHQAAKLVGLLERPQRPEAA